MLLDALVKVKAQDDSIAFRRSCRGRLRVGRDETSTARKASPA